MRRLRFVIWSTLVIILALVGFITLNTIGAKSMVAVKEVPEGDQEIVWIHTATNASNWTRFVAAIRHVEQSQEGVTADYTNAFPELTTAVPEVVLHFAGCRNKLWVRWYKLTSDASEQDWMAALSLRQPPPLAIVGGGSSDRARNLALALRDQKSWQGPHPLLLLTTATADSVYLGHASQPLMDIYPKRTFRFCFSNSQMAEAIRDFVWSQPHLRPFASFRHQVGAVALGASGRLLPMLVAAVRANPVAYVFEWMDDPYSLDLRNQFQKILVTQNYRTDLWDFVSHYSIGDFTEPNPQEAKYIQLLLNLGFPWDERRLLVLPCVDKPARRILRGLTVADPILVRRLVAVTGDSINFNTIYRDRNINWNIQEMPTPLVFFCHQNPTAWTQTSDGAPPGPFATATDDLLLNADIVRLLLESALVMPRRDKPGPARPCILLNDSGELAKRLHQRQPAFFQPDGNRRGGSGEFVTCLLPHIQDDRVFPSATIEVWRRKDKDWILARKMDISYGEIQEQEHPQ